MNFCGKKTKQRKSCEIFFVCQVFFFLSPYFPVFFAPLPFPSALPSIFVSSVDSASITAKSNLSKLNLAGPSNPSCCLSGAPQMRCVIRRQRGNKNRLWHFEVGADQKQQRALCGTKRTLLPFIHLPSFLRLVFVSGLSL